ncbi:MAG: helix-turn-helix domain-containing protein [Magnetococcales bacterium]|nr:helix-turn-helix domain-containing protein [Magnetococcales bacterium]
MESIPRFLSKRQPVAKGEMIFRSDQPFHGVYAVKSGSFKSYSLIDDQNEMIAGFYLPGELLGLDAIHSKIYGYNAIALEKSSVCLMPFNHLESLGEHLRSFQEQVIKILSDQIRQDQKQTLMAGRKTAEERLSAFLLNLTERYARHGFTANEFRLPMLQSDIANYLGLSMETVSRTMRKFYKMEILSIKGKRIAILNPTCLQSISNYCFASQPMQ